MRRIVYHGYSENYDFHIKVIEESPESIAITQVTLTRLECQKVLKHMQFGKKGETRVIETVNGEVVL